MIKSGVAVGPSGLGRTIAIAGLLAAAASCRRGTVPQIPTAAPAPVRPAPPAPTMNSGEAVVRAMRDKYAGKWYRTLTFTQKTTTTLASGGQLVQTWYEAAQIPGRLRIDTDLKSKSGTLFARDSIYAFNAGKLTTGDTGVNPLLILGFDVYSQPTNRTISVLRHLGFNLDLEHEGTWEGKPVYVVGAARGDTTSKQFWVDRDRLLFLRMIERGRQGRVDTRFNQYVESGGGWIAVEVVRYVDGRRRLLEEYSDVRTNPSIAEALFDPKQWTTVRHWITTPP